MTHDEAKMKTAYAEWFKQEIESGLAEIGHDGIATPTEVEQAFAKWGLDIINQ